MAETTDTAANNDTAPDAIALTPADLLDTGDLIRVEVPELMRNGRPGVVHMRYPKAREVMAYIGAPDAERGARLIDLTGKVLCNADGTALFPTADQRKRFQESRADVFSRLSKKVGELINSKDGDGDDVAGGEAADGANGGGTPQGNASNAIALCEDDGPTGGYRLTDSD